MKREPLVKIRPARPHTAIHYRADLPIQHWHGFRKGQFIMIGSEVVRVAEDALAYVGVLKVIRA